MKVRKSFVNWTIHNWTYAVRNGKMSPLEFIPEHIRDIWATQSSDVSAKYLPLELYEPFMEYARRRASNFYDFHHALCLLSWHVCWMTTAEVAHAAKIMNKYYLSENHHVLEHA